jgi:hypothetical protein
MKIISKDDLVRMIQISLGEPYNRVELAPEQYEVIIDRMIEVFHRYNAGEGSIYEYGVMELKKGQSEYNLRSIGDEVAYAINADGIPDPAKLQIINSTSWEDSVINIESVISVQGSSMATGGINSLFTPSSAWFYYGGGMQSLGINPGTYQGAGYTGGNYLGAGNSGVVSGEAGGGISGSILGYNSAYTPMLPLSSYVLARQNLAMIDRLFGERLLAVWRADAGLLRITPTPRGDRTALVLYYKRETAVYLYNNVLFQELVIAACGVKWGEILTKYGTNMAGGGTINGDGILNHWKEKYAAALEAVKGETWRPFFYKG